MSLSLPGTGLVTGLALLGVGGLLAAASSTPRHGLRVQALGAALLSASGYAVLAGGTSYGRAFASTFSPRVGVDPLSGFFLGTLGLVAAAALWFASDYLRPVARSRAVGALSSVFVLAMAGLFCARDPLLLLGSWELMTLVPAAVILVAADPDRRLRGTVFTYVAFTHVGGAGTWVAVLLLANAGAIGHPGVVAAGSSLQIGVAVAALIGMGTKVGLAPLHVWLPRAHPIAPAPISALMSGVMIKAGIYLLIRALVEWLGPLPIWYGALVIGLGGLSAVGGVLYALFQHDLKRLLAFHSIENIGIIVLGLGACLVLRARGAEGWAAIALAAALLHTVNHAVFKSLLFLGAGAFERVVGSLELDRLGGLLRRMPWTGGAFFIGAAAIAGLPPLNGFASEWLTLQALLHVPAYGAVGDGVVGAVALGALAATAALAVFCFVKVIGLVLLGPPRRDRIAAATEAPPGMTVPLLALALTCVVLGVAPGLLFGSLRGLAPWAASGPTRIGLDVPGTGSLPTVGIAAVLLGSTIVLAGLRRGRAAAPAPTWACGQLVEPRLRWSSAGFTKPLRLVLEVLLRPERDITVTRRTGVVQEVSYEGRVPHLIEERIYSPVGRWSMSAAARIRRLQSGSVGTYVGYLIGLVVLALVAARTGMLR